jgi:hypothetical protein
MKVDGYVWEVRFTLGEVLPNGDQDVEQIVTEAGFLNKGQAEAWLATGAILRYGPTFWGRVLKIEVRDGTPLATTFSE